MVDLLEANDAEFTVETPDSAPTHENEQPKADGGVEAEPAQNDTQPVESEPVEPNVVESATDPLPKVSPTEQTARDVIQHLTKKDMQELVWNPDAKAENVHYNPRNLPYDSPTPSAKAYDLFASIIESSTDIQYSVEEWNFNETEDTKECTVIIEKRSGEQTKQLVGMKTELKENLRTQAWRENLFAKARRNALKQDVPPTMMISLLNRFKEVQR